jgi:hypothetical protein
MFKIARVSFHWSDLFMKLERLVTVGTHRILVLNITEVMWDLKTKFIAFNVKLEYVLLKSMVYTARSKSSNTVASKK